MYRLEEVEQVQPGELVECRDMQVKILAEMADVLDQAYHSLTKAESIAVSAMETFGAQRKKIAEHKYQIAVLMGAGMSFRS